MKSEDFILFILAVIILTTKTANVVDTKIIGVGSATLDAGSTATLQVNLANAINLTGFSLEINLL